ncbi:unnamed protein product [Closterium sp. Yama58-4]|nr:unnamed protein product [Closterium sp. Yama58-4]
MKARSHGGVAVRRRSRMLAALAALMLSGVLSCSQVCSHAHRCALMLSGVLSCSQVCSHAHRCALMLSGVLSCSQVCSHAHRCALMLTGVLSCSQVCSHALRCALMLSGVLSCSQVCSHAHRCALMLSGVLSCSQVCSHALRCALMLSGLLSCSQVCSHALRCALMLSACAPRAAAVRLPAASNAADHSCVQRKCGANAICVKERGDATCVCNVGFSMTPVGCVDTCALKACGSNGKCSKDSAGVASCVCDTSFVLQADKTTCTVPCVMPMPSVTVAYAMRFTLSVLATHLPSLARRVCAQEVWE